MDPETVFLAQFQDFGKGIHGACRSRAHGGYNGADIAPRETLAQLIDIKAPGRIDGDGFKFELEDGTDATLGVMSLFAGNHFFVRCELPGDPESFQIGQRAAAAKMAE